jgi:hypothetical protein
MYNSPVNTFLDTGSTIWYIQVTKQLWQL